MPIIFDFLKKFKFPILWTIGYVFVLWLLMHTLFNFEIFSKPDWIHVMHAHLHGFGGFTFCLIVLAAIPLYIATMVLVFRNQKLLITIPVPESVKKIASKLFGKQDSKTDESEKNDSELRPTNKEIEQYPAEMRGAFIRARARPNRIESPICNVCSVTPNIYPNGTSEPGQPEKNDSELPLPPDFDIDDKSFSTKPSAPVFKDMNFDDDFNEKPSAPVMDKPEEKPELKNVVTEYFEKNNKNFTVQQGEIIVTDKSAIVVHDDDDFWIMDEPIWFASGKTRESPLDNLNKIASEQGLTQVLFIGSKNIMSFDEKCKEWQERGIRVVTDLSEL